MDPTTTEYLSIDEVCRRLKVSTRTVTRWLKNGVLTRYWEGGAVRMDPAEVDAIVVWRHDKTRRTS